MVSLQKHLQLQLVVHQLLLKCCVQLRWVLLFLVRAEGVRREVLLDLRFWTIQQLFSPFLAHAQTNSSQADGRTKFCQDYVPLRGALHALLNSLGKHKASLKEFSR